MDEQQITFSRGSFFHGTKADLKFPGNPTKTCRTKEPLHIAGGVTGWQGHSPEALQNMWENPERLERMGITAIE